MIVSDIGTALGDTKEQSIDKSVLSLIARQDEDARPASSIDQWSLTAVSFGKCEITVWVEDVSCSPASPATD
jgi:hypothetical protein